MKFLLKAAFVFLFIIFSLQIVHATETKLLADTPEENFAEKMLFDDLKSLDLIDWIKIDYDLAFATEFVDGQRLSIFIDPVMKFGFGSDIAASLGFDFGYRRLSETTSFEIKGGMKWVYLESTDSDMQQFIDIGINLLSPEDTNDESHLAFAYGVNFGFGIDEGYLFGINLYMNWIAFGLIDICTGFYFEAVSSLGKTGYVFGLGFALPGLDIRLDNLGN